MIRHRRSTILETAVIEARKGGAKIADIVKLCGRSERTIYKILHAAGLVKPVKLTRLKAGAAEELKALREQGVMVKELAARFGVSRVTVWKRLKGDEHGHENASSP